jgi:hypothetical protein
MHYSGVVNIFAIILVALGAAWMGGEGWAWFFYVPASLAIYMGTAVVVGLVWGLFERRHNRSVMDRVADEFRSGR